MKMIKHPTDWDIGERRDGQSSLILWAWGMLQGVVLTKCV